MALENFTALRKVLQQIRGYELEAVTIGRSASTVYRLVSPGMPTLFLKTAIAADAAALIAEHDRLRWLAGRVLVPKVVKSAVEANRATLLIEGLAGANGAEVPAHLWQKVTAQFAVALRRLHSVDPSECPFDQILEQVLPAASARAMAGRVAETDFDVERLGHPAIELLEPLYQERPECEDIVVTHGDACPPNLNFDGGTFSGFVDCGRCDRADRYQDLALAARSIDRNFGAKFVADFFGAYGIDSIDAEKVSKYQLVDELLQGDQPPKQSECRGRLKVPSNWSSEWREVRSIHRWWIMPTSVDCLPHYRVPSDDYCVRGTG